MVAAGKLPAAMASMMKAGMSSIKRKKSETFRGVITSFNSELSFGYVTTGGSYKGKGYGFYSTLCRGLTPEVGMHVIVTLKKASDGKKVVCATVEIDSDLEKLRKAKELLYDASDGLLDLSYDDVSKIDDIETTVADVIKVKKEESKRRDKLIKKKMAILKNACSAQVVWMLDCTGSMGSYITAAKDGIKSMKDQIIAAAPSGASLEFGFVGYRDYDDAIRFETLDFTPDTSTFQTKLSSVVATGGGDQCEDVWGGLNEVSKLSWKVDNGARLLFHVADAPTHGSFFAGGAAFSDDQKGFDSGGALTTSVLKKLCCDTGIQYVFCEINSSTKAMIKKYNDLLKSVPGCGRDTQIATSPLSEAGDIVKIAVDSTTASLATSYMTATMSLAKEPEHESMHSKFSSSILSHSTKVSTFLPTLFEGSEEGSESSATVGSYSLVPATSTRVGDPVIAKAGDAHIRPAGSQYVQIRTLIFPKSLSELKRPCRVNPLKWREFNVNDSTFFAKGGCRQVCNATDVGSQPYNNYVMKAYLDKPSTLELEGAAVLQDLQCQTCAAFLANEFTKLPEIKKKVSYLKAKTVLYKGKDGRATWGSVERVLSGFDKWCNNGKYCKATDDPDYSNTLEAFVHWTWHVTDGYMVVTDVQGLKTGDSFILTDPAIHCKDLTRFGATNMGPSGIDSRFSTHVCNPICEALKLRRHPSQPGAFKKSGTSAVH